MSAPELESVGGAPSAFRGRETAPPRTVGTAPAMDDPNAILRALTQGALRGALHAVVGNRAPDREVRDMLRQTCDIAHGRGVRAEQLLVLIKEAWRYLPEARRVQRHHADEGLTSVITLCIAEYYRAGR